MPRTLVFDEDRVGIVKDWTGASEPDGWIFASGRTIGNAASGGTALANERARNLFVHLWDNFADAQLAVSGGRGANATADFDANKTIALPDLRGRAVVGKDNMGGTTASRMTNGGSGITGTTLGDAGGAETHTLSLAQVAAHTHDIRGRSGFTTPSGAFDVAIDTGSGSAATLNPGLVFALSEGSGNSHQNTQPAYILNKIIKL